MYLSVKQGWRKFFFLACRKEKVDLQKLVKWSPGLVLEVIIETKVVQNISHRGRGFSQDHHFKAYQEFLWAVRQV